MREQIRGPTRRRGSGGLIAGLLGCIFAVVGIFMLGIIFVPLAIVCSLIGLLRGITGLSAAGIMVSVLGGVLSVVGVASSPSLLLLMGGAIVASQVDAPTERPPMLQKAVEQTVTAPPTASVPPATNASSLTFNIPPNANTLPLSGPASYCGQQSVIRNIIKALSGATAVKSANESVIDFEDSTTIEIDPKALTFSCRGIARISNGQGLPGTFSTKKNAAGDPIWNWMNSPR